MKKPIQFPNDFVALDNQIIQLSTNYVYRRTNGGGIISILKNEVTDLYEVWDEKFMEHPVVMNILQLRSYLEKEPIRNLIRDIVFN
jgi:hypothetical protein